MRIKKIMPLLAILLLCQSAYSITQVPMTQKMKERFLNSIKATAPSGADKKEIALIAGSSLGGVGADKETADVSKKKENEKNNIIVALSNAIAALELNATITTKGWLGTTIGSSTYSIIIPDGFFESVNAAFLKIDILAMPSHVTYSYLLTPMQAKYLKMKVAEDLYKKFTEKSRRWTSFGLYKSPQASDYQDKLVTKVVMDHLKPIIASKMNRVKKFAQNIPQKIKDAELVITKDEVELKTLKSMSEEFKTLKSIISQRQESINRMRKAFYDIDKLYKFRLSAVNDSELYSKYQSWFDGYVRYVGEYRKLSCALMEKEVGEKGEVLTDETLAGYKQGFMTALGGENVIERVKADIDKILSPTPPAPLVKPKGATTPSPKPLQLSKPQKPSELYVARISEILSMKQAERSSQALQETKATQLVELVKMHKRRQLGAVLMPEKKGESVGAKEPAIAGNIDALKNLRTRAAKLYAESEQVLVGQELSVASSHVTRNVMMKMIALAVVLPIIYVALTPGLIPGAVAVVQPYVSPGVVSVIAYAQGLAAKYPAIAAIFAKLQSAEFVGFVSGLRNSGFIKALIEFLRNQPAEFLAMLKASQFVKYLTNIDPVDISSYFSTITQSTGYRIFLQAASWAGAQASKGIGVFVGAVRSAKIGDLFAQELAPAGSTLPSGLATGAKRFAQFGGKAATVAGAGAGAGLRLLATIWSALSAASPMEFVVAAGGMLLSSRFTTLLFGEIINCFFSDPERKTHYHIYYTLMELRMSIAEMDFAIARQVDLAAMAKI